MNVQGRTKKDVLLEFRKSELLTAARTVFSRKGFHEATIDDIALEAGVAKGTVYLYFKSKHDIYLAALRDGVETLNEELRAVAAQEGPARDKLRKVIATKLAFLEEHRDFFQIFQSELGRVEATMNECKDLYIEQARIIELIIAEGMKEGTVLRLNARKAAFAVADLTKGIAIQRLLGWSTTRLNDEIEFIFGLLWRGIAK